MPLSKQRHQLQFTSATVEVLPSWISIWCCVLFCPLYVCCIQLCETAVPTWTHYIMIFNFHQQQQWFNNQEPDPGAAPADHQRVRGGHDQPHRPRQEVELQCRHDQDVGQEGGADPSQTVQEIYLSGFRQRARQGHGVWPPVSSYPQENIARSIQICSYLMVTIFGCWSHWS